MKLTEEIPAACLSNTCEAKNSLYTPPPPLQACQDKKLSAQKL